MTDTATIPPPPPATPETPATPRRPLGMIVGGVAIVVALIAGALVLVATQGGDEAEAQPLALRFTAGQTQTYEIHQTMDGSIASDLIGGEQPIRTDVTQTVTWRVTDVDEEGTATIEVTVEATSGTMNGMPLPAEATGVPPIEFRVARDGEIVEAGGLALGGAGQTNGFGFPGMGQLTPILPDGDAPVAPGDEWDKTFEQEFPFGDGTISYTAHSRYDRDEAVDGRDAAVVITDMTVPMDFTLDFGEVLAMLGDGAVPAGATGLDALASGSLAYDGAGTLTQTSFVDLERHELVKSSSTGEFDIAMTFAGVPNFEGEFAFSGTFTQDLTRR